MLIRAISTHNINNIDIMCADGTPDLKCSARRGQDAYNSQVTVAFGQNLQQAVSSLSFHRILVWKVRQRVRRGADLT